MEAKRRPQSVPESFRFALRVRHPSIDPEEISRELQLTAEHSFRAGQPRPGVGRANAASVYTESYWLAPLDRDWWFGGISLVESLPRGKERITARSVSLGAEGALSLLATTLSHSHAEFIRRLQGEGGEVSLLIELAADAMSGFTLTPNITRALGSLGIAVNFEFATN